MSTWMTHFQTLLTTNNPLLVVEVMKPNFLFTFSLLYTVFFVNLSHLWLIATKPPNKSINRSVSRKIVYLVAVVVEVMNGVGTHKCFV